MRLLFAVFGLLLTASTADSQLLPGNSSPNYVFGQIPSAAQWNEAFSSKLRP
jgi:hypothetical protein